MHAHMNPCMYLQCIVYAMYTWMSEYYAYISQRGETENFDRHGFYLAALASTCRLVDLLR